jgi:hypothetical protein
MPKADGHLHGTGSVVYYNLEYEKIAHRLFERAGIGWNEWADGTRHAA